MTPRRVYRHITVATEWIEDYQPGGFHPVHINDRLGPNDRYLILRKLGYGGYSTVWLARDSRCTIRPKYVAIKILKASSASTHQSSIYSQLSHPKPSGDGADTSPSTLAFPPWTPFIVPLLSSFSQHGPNGNHTCLVFEPMGCTVGDFLSQSCMSPLQTYHGLEISLAKKILRQMLGALVALHSRKLIHGDLHIGNVLLPLKYPPAAYESNPFLMPQDPGEEGVAQRVRRRDRQPLSENAPRYLIYHDFITPYCDLIDEVHRSKVIDIQGVAPEGSLQDNTPRYLQSPELILDGTATEFQDIWAFGFAMFELLTGSRLFQYDTYSTPTAQLDELMLGFSEMLGPLTPSLKAKWKNYSRFFEADGQRTDKTPYDRLAYAKEGEPGDEYESDFQSDDSEFCAIDMEAIAADIKANYNRPADEREALRNPPSPFPVLLEDIFDRLGPPDMGSNERNTVKSLLRSIFQYQPEKRPRAADLFKHPWFTTPASESSTPPAQRSRKRKRKRSNQKWN